MGKAWYRCGPRSHRKKKRRRKKMMPMTKLPMKGELGIRAWSRRQIWKIYKRLETSLRRVTKKKEMPNLQDGEWARIKSHDVIKCMTPLSVSIHSLIYSVSVLLSRMSH
jgi:hypothetical protein